MPRTALKTERLMKLLIMLLVQRQFVSKGRIREILYPEASTEAFERMFERDKEELRSLGVPVEVGTLDAYFEDEPGYRIRPDEFALPEIDLAPEEAAVVGLATRMWEHQRLAQATTDAVRKLTAAGLDIDPTALEIAAPRVGAEEPSFDVFWEAVLTRQAVTFDYTRSGQAAPATRHLQPWGVTRYSGRWYVVGFDTDRGEERVFRLSRVRGEARPDGPTDAYLIPSGLDLGAVARRLAPTPSADPAVLLVRAGAALPLRRAAARTDADVTGPDRRTTWDRIFLERGAVALADDVLGFGDSVYVESPASLRDEVVARLRALLAGTGGGDPR